ncbi:MAG: hypothetical protein OXG44_06215 [Gammaproteobacteria bacterium]|nr:hypothetical protein [Gammaproteobacteria bacterium]
MPADLNLRPFQRRFLKGAFRPEVRTAALSIPRGNGKSTLAAWLMARCLTPGDKLHRPGAEFHLCAASIGQVRRTTWRLLREFLADDSAYQWAESRAEVGVHHRPSGTRCTVLASSGKTAQGLVRCPMIVADEPGSWEVAGGAAMWDAIVEAQGKPGCDLHVVLIGTLAPAIGGWWRELIDRGSDGDTFVQALQGDPEKWDRTAEVRRVNPLMWRFPASRKLLLERRDKARIDPAAKARFLSYRINYPTGDERTMLLDVPSWKAVLDRPVPERDGVPVVGVDLGGGRSWSSAVAVWRNGRTEAIAVCGGIPGIPAQEKRDVVSPGHYQRLVDSGRLMVAGGVRVPPPALVMSFAAAQWKPRIVLCDDFRLGELRDCAPPGVRIVPRKPGWKAAGADVRALRQMAHDGPLSVAADSRALLQASVAVAQVKADEFGNSRMVKGASNKARDDVAAAWLLAAGALSRMRPRKPAKAVVCGKPAA